MGSLLFKRRNLCEIRALYRPLFRKGECDKLRPNGSKSREYDRTLYISSLIIVRRFGRDKDRGITFTKADTVRFGLRVLD
jgi:hypothetical protein